METSTPAVVRDQYLALKVMRLSSPKLYETICLGRDLADPLSVSICDSVGKLAGQSSVDLPLDSYLIAPHAMRDVYLGETFTLYISIINVSAFICKEIVIKVDIQTQNQRVALGEFSFHGIVLEPNQQIGQIYKHDILELGQHILVCSVTYRGIGAETQTDEVMSLRKFFKFPVTKLFDIVSHKFLHENQDSQSALFEVQLRNLCSSSVVIEHISLSDGIFKAMSRIDNPSSDVLSSKALRRYLFLLENLQPHQNNVGPMEIRWRATMGERGRIRWEKVAAQQTESKFDDLRLVLVQSPKEIQLNKAFTAEFQLQNKSSCPLDLLLTLVGTPSPLPSPSVDQQQLQFCPFVHLSLSGRRLPLVLPNQCSNITLVMLPIMHGLQTVSGIRLVDTLSKKTYEFDEVAKLFVYSDL